MTGTVLVGATGLGLILLFYLFSPFKPLQESLSDVLFQEGTGPSNVVIAKIDDATVQKYITELNNSPRTLHAKAISNLKAAGAKLIVFNLLITDVSPEDAALADAMKQAGNVILQVAGTQAISANDSRFQAVLGPPEQLRNAAFEVGHINVATDSDGVLRRVPLYIYDSQGNAYPNMAVSTLYAQSQRKAPRDLKVVDGRMQILTQSVPVDSATQFRPLFKALTSDFATISYADILDGKIPDSIRGKTVIVGGTFTGSGASVQTPIGRMEGVAVIGNAFDSLQSGVFVKEASRGVVVLSLLPMVAVMMYAVPRFNVRVAGLLLVLVAVASYVIFIALFNRDSDQRVIMNLVYPAILLPAMYVAGLGHRLAAERADRRELSDLFGRYASPQVMDQLTRAADRGQLNLGGTLREVTVLFADLRGFTGVSERLPPAEVVMFLNQAFDIMIRSIDRNDGFVNKFGGDMVMGVWNAPNDTTDHALKACKAAVEALREMAEKGLAVPDDPEAKFGFGINTGEVVAGNVGSAGRLEYSVIGDPVNVGSRLCGIAGGGEIYIGERTREMAGGHLSVELLGPKTLKGRSRPVETYRVISVDGVAVPPTTPSSVGAAH
jgi:adenylate cyclase